MDGHYLGVRSVRPEAAPLKYQFDLRYANPKPVRVRRIAWTWLAVCIGLMAMGAGALASAWSAGDSWVGVGAVGGAIAIGGGLFSFLRVSAPYDGIARVSQHAREATLASVTGGIGSVRSGKKFFVELVKNINAAKSARPEASSSSSATRCGSIIVCASWAC